MARAQEWLAANAELRPERVERVWGEGSDSVAVFHNMSFDDEKALIDEARAWQQRKADAGLRVDRLGARVRRRGAAVRPTPGPSPARRAAS